MTRRSEDPRPPRQGQLANLDSIRPAFFLAPELEREIVKLDGVLSARVLSSGSEIEEIHVSAAAERVPKKLVRDIESLLLISFGIRIDHRRISIVRLGENRNRAAAPVRPQIAQIESTPGEPGPSVKIQLSYKDKIYEGHGAAGAGENEMHAAGRAVISATEKLLGVDGILALEDVSLVKLGEQSVVVVLLTWRLEGEFLYLVGATSSRNDLCEAAARASFDALNRKLIRG